MGLYETEKLLHSKKKIVKRRPKEWEVIKENQTFDKGLICNVYKELL
jgi:hypothetical protein